MSTTFAATSSSNMVSFVFRRPADLLVTGSFARQSWTPATALGTRKILSCHLAVATEVSSSSSTDSVAEEEAEAAAKIGARIRVKSPIKIYHVMKAPGLDLCGLEGVVKQYVGVWKGKRISANLPFKVEFILPADGEEKPIKFVAHLREEEFEYLNSSD
ncbi:hypothetical protein HPP92_003822 [Vanilla planifolia]|uniref:Ferredoxin thioredoxin reductase alpha chain domain-containing protein n=1 Tax=Vanilla planifolia TaxID=51239 RepID=A0A835S3Q8_VANPL|nr:hypothetical protein HPP92_004266 [Vanilla planifolia]KAG0503750.1 hypothetical protein HPP92_003822 [Vanilla planifolia]